MNSLLNFLRLWFDQNYLTLDELHCRPRVDLKYLTFFFSSFMLCFNLFWFSMLWVSLHTRQLVSFYTYLLAFATVPLSYLMNSFTVSYIIASDPMVQLPFSLLSMFITTLLLLSSKTVAGLFWYWSQFTLGLSHIFLGITLFCFSR